MRLMLAPVVEKFIRGQMKPKKVGKVLVHKAEILGGTRMMTKSQ